MARNVVAITGASSGIGAAFARRLAPEHDLLLIARRQDRLEQISRELSSKYESRAEVLKADLTSETDLAMVAERIANEERLVLLVNNAGFGTKGRFWEAPVESQELMHKLHVMATLRLSHAALRNMVARDVGAVINVASVSAWVRVPGSIGYSATKSWMTVFTEGLHLELRSKGSHVAVQALCPGFTYTELHDNLGVDRSRLAGPRFWMTPQQIVDASLNGLQRRKLFVIPGWRYRLITAFLATVPTGLRLAIESIATRARQQEFEIGSSSSNQLESGE